MDLDDDEDDDEDDDYEMSQDNMENKINDNNT
jgi:hypothetical protein